MLKMRIFLEKTVKNRPSVRAPPPNPRLLPAAGGSAPKPWRCYSRWRL